MKEGVEMSFCCGASMIGTLGSLKHKHTFIHEVPLVYCPICQSIEVHVDVREEYEILVEYAQTDHAPEVYFGDYVDLSNLEELFAGCIDIEKVDMKHVLRSQIDNALDLLSIAKKMKDEEWTNQLYERLTILSKRLRKHQKGNQKQNINSNHY